MLCVGNGWQFCKPVLMNMSNKTFEVLRLSTFVFEKCSEKIHSRLIIVIRAKRVFMLEFCWPGVTDGGPALNQNWVNASCYLVFLAPGWEAPPALQCSSQKTRYNHPMLFQYWASVEDCGSTLKQHRVNATSLRKNYWRPSGWHHAQVV